MKNIVRRIVAIGLLIAGTSAGLAARNPQQVTDKAIELERMRIQAEERARADADQRNWETRIFPVRYIDPNQLHSVLTMFRGAFQPNQALRVISALAPKEIMPAIEDAIKRLDVPTPGVSKSTDLSVYVLMASDLSDPGNVPASLQPVINQLRGILTYKSYQLVETLLVRGSDGRSIALNGSIQGIRSGALEPTSYSLGGEVRIQNPDGKTPVLQLRNMQFRFPSSGLHIGTDVEIPQGQQVIVGKATMGDRAFILVMSAKFSN